ncbi:hypothetical protein NFJ02_20g44010 [Pycnococcus provasolii]
MAAANQRARVSSTGMSSAARVCSCEFAWCKAASDDELSKLTVHFLPSAGHEERAKRWLDVLTPSSSPEARARWLGKRRAAQRPRFKAWHFPHTAWFFRDEFSRWAKARQPRWELKEDAVPTSRKCEPPPQGVAARWDAHSWVAREKCTANETRALKVTMNSSPPRKRMKPLDRINIAAVERLRQCSELTSEDKLVLMNLVEQALGGRDEQQPTHAPSQGGGANVLVACDANELPNLTDSDEEDIRDEEAHPNPADNHVDNRKEAAAVEASRTSHLPEEARVSSMAQRKKRKSSCSGFMGQTPVPWPCFNPW